MLQSYSFFTLWFMRLFRLMAYLVLVHHGCSSGLIGPHPTTIHYTTPRFISKDPGLQLLENPLKQVVVRDIMINPKMNLGLTRGSWRLHKTYCFRYHWDSVSKRHKTSKLCMLHTRLCGTPYTHNTPNI